MATAVSRPLFKGRHLTNHEFDRLRLPETNAHRFELLDGHILVSPFGSHAHQRICTRLVAVFFSYVETPGIGEVHSPGVVYGPSDIELQPDVLVTSGRTPLSKSWIALGTRLLAIEVLSQWTGSIDVAFKRGAYLELGFAEVWLVNPRAGIVTVAGRGPRDLELTPPAMLTWHAPGAVSPLTIDLAALFADD